MQRAVGPAALDSGPVWTPGRIALQAPVRYRGGPACVTLALSLGTSARILP